MLRIRTLWWIILSGLLFNFNAYAINVFQTPFLQRFHALSLQDANLISGLSLGLAGAIGLLLGGWLGDRLRVVMPTARVLLPAIGLLIAVPCVVVALQQPKGGVVAFTLLMGTSTALSFVYYSTVYSAIQDVVPPNLRGTAVSLYFFAMYVLGASFGSTIMGALSDYFAHQAMVAAGASEMADAFRADWAAQCDVCDPRVDVVVFGVAVRRGPNHSGRHEALTCAGEAFHHQARAAFGHMRDDGRASMNFGDDAEIDGERQVHRGAFFQSQVFGLDEYAVGAQVARAAQLSGASRDGNVNGGTRSMTCMETSLHAQTPRVSVPDHYAARRRTGESPLMRSYVATDICSCTYDPMKYVAPRLAAWRTM